MKVIRVQYTVQPDYAEQNKQNIEAVMQEVRQLANPDFKYATYVLEDGKTFMHLAYRATSDVEHLPTSLESFKQYQTQLQNHLEVPPKNETLNLVQSSYDLF
jgi:hypothetical protein